MSSKMRLFVILFFLLLIPQAAFAFGPATHLELGLDIVRDLSFLAPALALLLRRFTSDFLYGTIAADITVAKNRVPYYRHCHNWRVGFQVLNRAKNDEMRAFAWGYLTHLAADTVAHNYLIPYKNIEYYRMRRALHVYWEMRVDMLAPSNVWENIRKFSSRSHRRHDKYLESILIGSVLPFRLNQRIFRGLILAGNLLSWQRAVNIHTQRTRLILTAEEVGDLKKLSLDFIRDLLKRGAQSKCLHSDPAGQRSLLVARDVRKRLRALDREGRLREPEKIGALFRPLFREGIGSKLALPSMIDLINPDAPASKKRPLGLRRRSTKPNISRV
jgi:hypothetical protein